MLIVLTKVNCILVPEACCFISVSIHTHVTDMLSSRLIGVGMRRHSYYSVYELI